MAKQVLFNHTILISIVPSASWVVDRNATANRQLVIRLRSDSSDDHLTYQKNYAKGRV
jgi:hypothetical protein